MTRYIGTVAITDIQRTTTKPGAHWDRQLLDVG